jgi:hypothetical protein
MIHRQRLRVSIEGDGEPVKKTDLAPGVYEGCHILTS